MSLNADPNYLQIYASGLVIASSRNSTISKVEDPQDPSNHLALKVVTRRSSSQLEAGNQLFAMELSDDVVPIRTAFNRGKEFCILMEYYERGSLSQEILRRREHRMPWAVSELTTTACSLLHLVQRMHAAGLTHRDLKPDNFLVSDSGSLKLGDFGSSRRGSFLCNERRGTVIYMPPELYMCSSGPYDYCKVDSYALGKTLYEMASLNLYESLYSEFEDEEKYYIYVDSKLTNIDEHLKQVILGLVTLDANKRWTCEEAYQFLSQSGTQQGVATPIVLKSEDCKLLSVSTQSHDEVVSDTNGTTIEPFDQLKVNSSFYLF